MDGCALDCRSSSLIGTYAAVDLTPHRDVPLVFQTGFTLRSCPYLCAYFAKQNCCCVSSLKPVVSGVRLIDTLLKCFKYILRCICVNHDSEKSHCRLKTLTNVEPFCCSSLHLADFVLTVTFKLSVLWKKKWPQLWNVPLYLNAVNHISQPFIALKEKSN